MISFFNWPKNIPAPRDSRQVLTPISESNLKVVKDLIPTASITESYPTVGTTTYAQCNPAGQMQVEGNAMEFATYVLRKMEPDAKPGWTRCTFGPVISSTDALTEVLAKRKTYQDDHLWHDILHKVDLLPDYSFTRVTRSGGREINGVMYYPRIYHTPSVTEGTLFIKRYFIGSEPFIVGQSECPKPDSVSFSILGVEGSWPRCIHEKLVFDRKQTAIATYSAGVLTDPAGSIAGQLFPETNYTTWEPYDLRKTQTDIEDALYELEVITVVPPDPPEIVITTT